MDPIATKHAHLISGLNQVYATLIAMRYVCPEDMVRPPHTTRAILDDTFQLLGYEDETVQLIRLLPFVRGDVAWGWQRSGTEILPRSQVVSYAIERDSEWTQYLRWGDHTMSPNHQLLPPWMLRLTIGQMYPGQYGTDLIYDTRTRTIIEWSRLGTHLWDQGSGRPADAVFVEILQKFTSLDWVPFFDESSPGTRQILDNPIYLQNMVPGAAPLPTDPTLAVAQIRRDSGEQSASVLREQINRWRSVQRLYQASSWGTEGYDPEEFAKMRREWFTRLKQLDRQGRLARRMTGTQREDFRVAKEAFWAVSAGANAV
ncbi:hypothetical protein NX059_010074 [Plenodomus lindquistii]|nr:hypothetical protein NX059_010074 [Plenodomus lindquistii]